MRELALAAAFLAVRVQGVAAAFLAVRVQGVAAAFLAVRVQGKPRGGRRALRGLLGPDVGAGSLGGTPRASYA